MIKELRERTLAEYGIPTTSTMDQIHRFAKICRVANVMRPYLESAV
jgi:hypothetical protein